MTSVQSSSPIWMNWESYKILQDRIKPGICAYSNCEGKICGVQLNDIKWESKLQFRCHEHRNLIGFLEDYLLKSTEVSQQADLSLWVKFRIFESVIRNAPYIMCGFMPNCGFHNNLVCAAPVNNPQHGLDPQDYRCDKHVTCNGYIRNIFPDISDLMYTNDMICEIPNKQLISKLPKVKQHHDKDFECHNFEDYMRQVGNPNGHNISVMQKDPYSASIQDLLPLPIPELEVKVNTMKFQPIGRSNDYTPTKLDEPPSPLSPIRQPHSFCLSPCADIEQPPLNDLSPLPEPLNFNEPTVYEKQIELMIKFSNDPRFAQLRNKVNYLKFLYPSSSTPEAVKCDEKYERIKPEIIELDDELQKLLVSQGNMSVELFRSIPYVRDLYFDIERLKKLFDIPQLHN